MSYIPPLTDGNLAASLGDWALTSDDTQWILLRKNHAVAYVHSTRDVLARCLREGSADEATARFLLSGLAETFDLWKRQSLVESP
jgi:hypothetical protein